MIRTERTLQEKFGEAIGHKLRKVVASVHVFGAEALSDAPLCLWFFFEALPVVRLSGAPDGWSIQADDTLPEPIDMEESGEIILRDVSRRSIFQQGLERNLQAVWLVQLSHTGETICIRFDFGQPIRPLVLNWGDELYIAKDYPDDAQDGEILEVPIKPMERVIMEQ